MKDEYEPQLVTMHNHHLNLTPITRITRNSLLVLQAFRAQ
jgi:hypothetical protein